MKREVTEALRSQFRPEFLNRVDEVIVFPRAAEADLTAIVELLLADLGRRLAQQDIALELTPAARALIVREAPIPRRARPPSGRSSGSSRTLGAWPWWQVSSARADRVTADAASGRARSSLERGRDPWSGTAVGGTRGVVRRTSWRR